MTQQISLTSLEELGQFADVIVSSGSDQHGTGSCSSRTDTSRALDIDALVETIRRSAEELQVLSAADAQAQEAGRRSARKIPPPDGRCRATSTDRSATPRSVAEQATALSRRGVLAGVPDGAARVAVAAAVVADEAQGRLESVTAEADALGVRDDVARLLAEERQREETASAKRRSEIAKQGSDGGDCRSG